MPAANNPHDAVFRRFLTRPADAAAELRAMLPAAIADQVRWDELEQVPGSFVDPDLRWRHSDVLFKVPLRDTDVLIYILMEHQSEPDPLMPFRKLRYLTRAWDSYLTNHPGSTRLPAIFPLVVHHGQRPWRAPTTLSELIDGDQDLRDTYERILRFEFALDDLATTDIPALRARALTPAALVTLVLLKTARGNPRITDEFPALSKELNAIAEQRDDIVALLTYVNLVTETPASELRHAAEQLGPAIEEAYMTTAELLRTEGRAETLAELLTAKFGALNPAQRDRLHNATEAELTDWTTRILTATSTSDLLGD